LSSNFYQIVLVAVLVLATVFVTWLVRFWAIKKSIIDIPNERSSHTVPTPRGGGLAIVVVWYTFLTFAFFAGHMPTQLYLALMSSIVLAGVSFIDDIRNLSPRIRLASQLVSAVLALYFLGGLQSIDLGFTILKLPVWTNILVVVAILWAINLFNFLDGIDGYLGMEGVFVFVTLFLFTHDFNTLAFAAVIAGFLVWNWPKAKIFCGDIGSTVIGFTIMVFGVNFQNTGQLSVLVPLILSGLFWVDASLTLWRRFRNKEQLSIAHRKHAYQRFTQAGFSHRKVVLLGVLVNGFLLLISIGGVHWEFALLPGYLLHIGIVFLFVRQADKKKAFE